MKIRSILIIKAIFLSNLTSAAPIVVGNGGAALVCRDRAGQIKSAEILDLFEGRKIYGYKQTEAKTVTPERILGILKDHPRFQLMVQNGLALAKERAIYLDSDVSLLPTNDVYPSIEKTGCRIEQLANFEDNGSLLISRPIYDRLSKIDREAFWFHEAIYYTARLAGAKNSVSSRRLTAYLFSEASGYTSVQTAELHALLFELTNSPEYSGEVTDILKIYKNNFWQFFTMPYRLINLDQEPISTYVSSYSQNMLYLNFKTSGTSNELKFLGNSRWMFIFTSRLEDGAALFASMEAMDVSRCYMKFKTYRAFELSCEDKIYSFVGEGH